MPVDPAMEPDAIRFHLFTRAWCHLCEDMLAALRSALDALAPGEAFSIEEFDVDADPALLAKYDERVPVLVGHRAGQPPAEICHYFLDSSALAAFLSGTPFASHDSGSVDRV